VVGPAVSAELRRTGIIAVLASLVAISVYVWFRFEWQFAVGCVLALLHDVLVTVGIFSLFQLDFDLSIVAALLTILGYSVNDSVVVSDRIRENLRKFKRMDLNELLNISINETLSRTILTGVTAIAGITALLIFGGEVLRLFSFAMLFGIVIGTYSSIFIAAPLLGYLGVKRDAFSGGKAKEAAPVIAPATTAGADRAKAAATARPVQAPAKKAATPRR
jgi:preprotein translocase SecF subunit